MRALRVVGLWITSLVGGVLAMGLGAGAGEWINTWLELSSEPGLVEGLGGLLGLVVFLTLLVLFLARRRSQRLLRQLEQERQTLEATEDPFLQQAELLLFNLRRQYEIVHSHANVSLYASLTAASVALVALLAALHLFGLFGRVGESNSDFLGSFAALSGAVSSFISATFGIIYRSSDRKLTKAGQILERRNEQILALRDARELGREGDEIRLAWARRVFDGPAESIEIQQPTLARRRKASGSRPKATKKPKRRSDSVKSRSTSN